MFLIYSNFYFYIKNQYLKLSKIFIINVIIIIIILIIYKKIN